MILTAQRSFLVKDSYAWLLILAIVGLALSGLFDWFEKRMVFWHASQNGKG